MVAKDFQELRRLKELIEKTIKARLLLPDGSSAETLDKVIHLMILRYASIINAPPELNSPLPKVKGKMRTIDSFEDEKIPLYFRFNSKQQLHEILECFKFPPVLKSPSSKCKFGREELLLVSLYRLHYPTTNADPFFQTEFGFGPERVSVCLSVFLDFMVSHWGYLLLDNMGYWLPQLPAFAQAIRDKLADKGCEFPAADQPNGFNVFGFIDNTMNACCRIGGGPSRDGVNAPRNDPEIQRAWYNGWKKLHGFKWQTIDLPNGMNFHVWGPVSARHCDLYTLGSSGVNLKLQLLQLNRPHQYVIYGDSAYPCDTHLRSRHDNNPNSEREVLENRCMGSCREVIEWDYGNLGQQWKALDYRHGLKMRKQPVAKMYLVGMLLRNSYNCQNHGQTSLYFNCPPPTLHEWTAGGPRAHV
jgi:DDE superfamily endonuclease